MMESAHRTLISLPQATIPTRSSKDTIRPGRQELGRFIDQAVTYDGNQQMEDDLDWDKWLRNLTLESPNEQLDDGSTIRLRDSILLGPDKPWTPVLDTERAWWD